MKILHYIILLLILGINTSCIREDNTPVTIPPIEGATIAANVGGATHPHQVWIDLSENSQTFTQRHDWDLAFYNGEQFRVLINSSIMMAVGKVDNQFNIDEVNSQSVSHLKSKIQVGNFQPNEQYIDHPSGNFLAHISGIAEISKNDNQNPVYLLNMGRELYIGNTSPGRVFVGGAERGWMKIRILKTGSHYKIQFAELDSNTHDEFIIEKNKTHHFNFFSLKQKKLVNIQPPKTKWDLCFTVLTNTVKAGEHYTSYTFSDMVLTNILDKVKAYEVKTQNGQGETAYKAFKKTNIDESLFITNDQRTIGSNWRTTTGPKGAEVFSDRFYILKDSDGFYFKLRFLKMLNNDGYRGFPEFEYEPL